MLKKSAMVCASEKYASEIEIFTFGRGFRTRISRSSVQKRHFHRSMIRQFGQIDFFNRIGWLPPFRRGISRLIVIAEHLRNPGRFIFIASVSQKLPYAVAQSGYNA